eukprot:TRINITY_DN24446_c0_g1_i1.p1 TRINITY_DN24446_c0_g1~~TRINITY_DN24446_c0_g1_i1.p1  ORF type:complete len:687 (-),score=68.24 TRINITY_DN24446_c0_g1_i1:66-2126(-)
MGKAGGGKGNRRLPAVIGAPIGASSYNGNSGGSAKPRSTPPGDRGRGPPPLQSAAISSKAPIGGVIGAASAIPARPQRAAPGPPAGRMPPAPPPFAGARPAMRPGPAGKRPLEPEPQSQDVPSSTSLWRPSSKSSTQRQERPPVKTQSLWTPSASSATAMHPAATTPKAPPPAPAATTAADQGAYQEDGPAEAAPDASVFSEYFVDDPPRHRSLSRSRSQRRAARSSPPRRSPSRPRAPPRHSPPRRSPPRHSPPRRSPSRRSLPRRSPPRRSPPRRSLPRRSPPRRPSPRRAEPRFDETRSFDNGKARRTDRSWREHNENPAMSSYGNDLNHGRVFRLLKLIQRNKRLIPDSEVTARWNDFCDRAAPQMKSGQPVRDPKHLSKELILEFLVTAIPRTFWTCLVQKIQGYGDVFAGDWTEFCDTYAPRKDDRSGIRDPRKLDTEFILWFIACSLEGDDRSGGHLAALIDQYQFDFGASNNQANSEDWRPEPARWPVEAAPPQSQRVIGAIGQIPTPQLPAVGPPDREHAEAYGYSAFGGLGHGNLHRLLKLIQRNSHTTPEKAIYSLWNEFCDDHSPHDNIGRPIRDPKALPREHIEQFLVRALPEKFWIYLTKKIQGHSRELQDAWTIFCDAHAPALSPGGQAIRDPKKLSMDILIAYIAYELDLDNNVGVVAKIVDDYAYDFTK